MRSYPAGLFDPGDFLEGEGGAEEVFRKSLAPGDVVGGDGLVARIQIEAAVFPIEELAGLFLADEFFAKQDCDEAVAEEFGERFEGLHRYFVEAPFAIVEAGGGEDMEVRVKDEVYFSALGFRNLKGLEILCHQALQVWAVLPSERIDKLIDRRHELGEVLEMSGA